MATLTAMTVPTPARDERLGGIRSVANVYEVGSRLFGSENAVWEPNVCGSYSAVPQLCWLPDEGDEKGFAPTAEWGETIQTRAIYSGVECFAGPNQGFLEEAIQNLEQSQWFMYESRLAGLFSDPDWSTTSPYVSASLAEAIARAEAHLDDFYGETTRGYVARGTLSMSRGIAVFAAAQNLVFSDGNGNLSTINGTKVLAAGVIKPGMGIVASGQISLYLSDIQASIAVQPETNREMAIAERAYTIGFDCMKPYAYTFTPAFPPVVLA